MADLGSELDSIVAEKQEARRTQRLTDQKATNTLESFFTETVAPAIDEFAAELEKRDRTVSKQCNRRNASLDVAHDGATEFRIYFEIENNIVVYKQEFLDKKDGRAFRTMSPLSPQSREALLGLLINRYRQGY